ncbi:DNA cytosine methyltransferase [Kineosporia babensis]|uniref:DNA (cytosine-5-)-methyltransferase n=1 Tax=Kineosporia babensis TaxID=499548 RepID=A0A9X1SYL3_9ACTN|nr:DNA cytosine methyltransferase [Kineosporia babensis]MCD5317049.1 DNA cytosine methyltransferase [Kineosporia babensis]
MGSDLSPTDEQGSIQMVDLFAGPGGLDVAATWLGLRASGVEWDRNARTTRAAAGLITAPEGDVRDNKPSDFPEASILVGGPPCQTFTVAGSGAGRRALTTVLDLVRRLGDNEDITETVDQLDDERTGLVLQPLHWALEAQKNGAAYKTIVLEQVPAVLPVWQGVGEVLKKKGYGVATGLLKTEQFGVPQTRRRAILIARLGEEEVFLPSPTHRHYNKGMVRSSGDSRLKEWATMGEALDPWRSPFTVVSNYGTGGDPKARGRRSHAEPAFTVTGKVSRNLLDDIVPVFKDRFTLEEAGRLQTFPAFYPWSGMDKAQQIGNAIPPRLAAHVLAAALGIDINLTQLDLAVKSAWDESRLINIVDGSD